MLKHNNYNTMRYGVWVYTQWNANTIFEHTTFIFIFNTLNFCLMTESTVYHLYRRKVFRSFGQYCNSRISFSWIVIVKCCLSIVNFASSRFSPFHWYRWFWIFISSNTRSQHWLSKLWFILVLTLLSVAFLHCKVNVVLTTVTDSVSLGLPDFLVIVFLIELIHFKVLLHFVDFQSIRYIFGYATNAF